MKTRTAIFVIFAVIVCLNFVFGQKATAQEPSSISGVIVYLNEEGRFFFFDLSTKEVVDFASFNPCFKKIFMKSNEFGVSKDGKILAFKENERFWGVDLPYGTPKPYAAEIFGSNKNAKTTHGKTLGEEEVIWPKAVSNIAVSSKGKLFFESPHYGVGWVEQKGPQRPISIGDFKNGKRQATPQPEDSLPFYAQQNSSCVGIFTLSKEHNRWEWPSCDLFLPRYGNVVELPPEFQYRCFLGPYIATTAGDLAKPEEGIYSRKGLAKNAYCPRFSDNGFMAFFYQLQQSKLIAIEIRLANSPFLEMGYEDYPDVMPGEKTTIISADLFRKLYPKYYRDNRYGSSTSVYNERTFAATSKEKLQKAMRWEIQIPTKSCTEIAWTPDKSITILDENGKLYEISQKEIERVISQSGIKKVKASSKREFTIKPTNNVIQTIPKLIGIGINGICHNWVSADAFIFLEKDKSVYHCNKDGKKTKLLGPILSRFCYCETSPLKNSNANISGKEKLVFVQGQDQEKIGENKAGHIVFNVVKNLGVPPSKGLTFSLLNGRIGSQPPFEYCETTETDFAIVRSKTGWNFKKNIGRVKLGQDEIILLRLDGRVIGVKFKKEDENYRSFSYEWEFISASPKQPKMETDQIGLSNKKEMKAKTPEKKSLDEKISPLKIALKRQFSYQGIRFVWEQTPYGETYLVAKMKPETRLLGFAKLENEAVDDIDELLSCSFEEPATYKIKKKNLIGQSIRLNPGDTIIVRIEDSKYLLLRLMDVDNNGIVTYKKKPFLTEGND